MIEWTTISLALEFFFLFCWARSKGPENLRQEPDTIEWLNFQVDDHSRKSFGMNNNIYRNYDNCNSTALFFFPSSIGR